MILRDLKNIAVIGVLGLAPACIIDSNDDATGPNTSNATTGETTAPTSTEPTTTESSATDTVGTDGTSTGPGGEDAQLCANLGGYDGVKELIKDFVGRVLIDDRINAYFLTTDVDGGRLTTCLEEQVGAATGCFGIVYTCMDMKTVHAGMGISMNDFGDLADDFSKALDAHQANTPSLTDGDKDAVLVALGGMVGDIVEDPSNNTTTYQKIGRKPGIATVIGSFDDPKSLIGLVAVDPTLNSFFNPTTLPRLQTCLIRQVTQATDGPQIYGKEVTAPVPADPGVTTETPCRDMMSSHVGLMDAMGVGIEKADFDALVAHLVTAMDNYVVPMTEQNVIIGALAPLCSMIVNVDPAMCG